MLVNENNQELVSESTTGSIDRNSRPSNFSNPKDIRNVPRVVLDTISGGLWTYRTFVGADTGSGYLGLGLVYDSYRAGLTVEQRQELSTAINNNAALCRKRWAYS